MAKEEPPPKPTATGWIVPLSGLAVGAVGVVSLLYGLEIIEIPGRVDAPRWVATAIGGVFLSLGVMLAGFWLPKSILGVPLRGPVQGLAGVALLLGFFTTMAVFLTWMALAPAGAEGRTEVGGIGLPLPRPVAGVASRIFIGFFALIMDILALAAWWGAVKYVVGRLRGESPEEAAS
jgi:hypothetical protein